MNEPDRSARRTRDSSRWWSRRLDGRAPDRYGLQRRLASHVWEVHGCPGEHHVTDDHGDVHFVFLVISDTTSRAAPSRADTARADTARAHTYVITRAVCQLPPVGRVGRHGDLAG